MPSDGKITRSPSARTQLAARLGRILNRAGYKRYQTINRGTVALAGYKLNTGLREATVGFRDGSETDGLYVQDKAAYEAHVREQKKEHVALYAAALTAAGMRVELHNDGTYLTVYFED